jgi:hypothetical protein
LFIPFGMVWAGGWLGRVTAQAMYWSAAVRDKIDEWRAGRVEERRKDAAAREAENRRLARLAARAEAAKPLSVRKRRKVRAE